MPATAALPDTTANLTPIQHQALALLATGVSIAATARACAIHRTTIHYWKRSSPDFSEALFDAQLENADHWRAQIQKRAEAALATVDALLADPKTPASVKLKLAIHILNAATSAPVHHISTLHHYQAPLHPEDARSKDVITRCPQEAVLQVDHPAASAPPPNRVLAQLRQQQSQHNSSHFDISTPVGEKVETIRRNGPKTGRNDACPCGSSRKFKQCCLNKPRVTVNPLPASK